MSQAVRSMTGAGSFVLEHALGRLEAEARAVNHRFLKVSWRASGPVPDLTLEIEEQVRARVARGHVTLQLRFTPRAGGAADAPLLDARAFAAAAAELAALARAAGLAPVTASDVLRVPGVASAAAPPPGDDAALAAAVKACVDGALAALDTARRREGAALEVELRTLLDAIERAAAALAARAAEVPKAWQERLRARLTELLEGTGATLAPEALAREVAAMAERSDVREELTRLAAHIAHARELLGQGGQVGRPLDFLAQELARETNTVGSKANDLALTRTVIGLKADVERLREQVQNLE